MKYSFLNRHLDGSFWKAGKTLWRLCCVYNHATNPGRFMTDTEHHRARQYARAVRNRMNNLGYRYGFNYRETESGVYWPLRIP